VPYQVTVNSGLSNVVLPNGLRYTAGGTAVLSDEQYSVLSANAVSTLFSSVAADPSSVTAATEATVASSASNVTLFSAATGAVGGRTVFNDSTAVLYVKFGATASATSYTVQVPAGGFFEFPAPVYGGRVDGIWASANGNARLTSW